MPREELLKVCQSEPILAQAIQKELAKINLQSFENRQIHSSLLDRWMQAKLTNQLDKQDRIRQRHSYGSVVYGKIPYPTRRNKVSSMRLLAEPAPPAPASAPARRPTKFSLPYESLANLHRRKSEHRPSLDSYQHSRNRHFEAHLFNNYPAFPRGRRASLLDARDVRLYDDYISAIDQDK